MRVCEQHAKRWCWWCLGTTLAFPLEHLIWTRWPLSAVSHWFGL
jgi:hypothetical protein